MLADGGAGSGCLRGQAVLSEGQAVLSEGGADSALCERSRQCSLREEQILLAAPCIAVPYYSSTLYSSTMYGQ